MRIILAIIFTLNGAIVFAQTKSSKANISFNAHKGLVNNQAILPEDKEDATIFIIDTGFFGDVDMTDTLVKYGAKFIFTKDNDGDMCFMNIMSGKSYGKINKLKYNPSALGNPDTLTFIWYYKNSYNSKEGFADVVVVLKNNLMKPLHTVSFIREIPIL